MRGRSWRSFANITITNGRTALWRTERRRHSRRYKGWKQKKLVHRWGAHSRASSLSLWSARDPHEIRGTGLLTLKNSSSGWYRKMGRVRHLKTLVPVGTEKWGGSTLKNSSSGWYRKMGRVNT